MYIKLASYTSVGSRAENEDSSAYEQTGPEQLYAVVCDSLGSHGGGQAASRAVVTQLQKTHFSQLPTAPQILDWMQRGN